LMREIESAAPARFVGTVGAMASGAAVEADNVSVVRDTDAPLLSRRTEWIPGDSFTEPARVLAPVAVL